MERERERRERKKGRERGGMEKEDKGLCSSTANVRCS